MEKTFLLNLPEEFIHTCRIYQLEPQYILQTFINEASAGYHMNIKTDDAGELAFQFIEKRLKHSEWPVGNEERLIYRRHQRILTRYNLDFFNNQPRENTLAVLNQIFRNWYNDLKDKKREHRRFPFLLLPGLRSVDLSGAVKLQIEQGDTEELCMSCPEDKPLNILWKFKNGHLTLVYSGPVAYHPFTIKSGLDTVFDSHEYEVVPMLTLHLTCKYLDALTVAAAARVEYLTPVRSKRLRLSAYGRSLIDADAEAGELDVVVKEDSQLFLYGFAHRSRYHLSGAAKLLGSMVVDHADVKMENDSLAVLNVKDQLTANLGDQALLIYQFNGAGEARISLHGASRAVRD